MIQCTGGFKKVINKIKKIFQEHYKKEFFLQYSESFGEKDFLAWNECQTPFIYSEELRQVCFPIFSSKKRFKILVTVRPVYKEDSNSFSEMADFLSLTLAEPCKLKQSLRQIKREEEVLARLSSDPGKVIPLRTKRSLEQQTRKTTGKQSQNEINQSFLDFRNLSKNKTNLDPLWIIGDKSQHNRKVAFSIHNLTSNWAFMDFREISDLIWKDCRGWETFPHVTVLISDIELLSDSKIACLQKSLGFMEKLKEKPFLIITSGSLSKKSHPGKSRIIRKFFKSYEIMDDNFPPSSQARIIFCQHKNYHRYLDRERLNSIE